MTRTRLCWIFAISSLLLAAMMGLVYWKGESGSYTSDAATALLLVTTTAVAIERTIELFWTFAGGMAGSYWPLNLIATQANGMVKDLDNTLAPFHQDVTAALKALAENNKVSQERLAVATTEINALAARFDKIKSLPLDNQKMQILIAVAEKDIAYVSKKYGDLIERVDHAQEVAGTAIKGMQDFVGTFQDNPGRRLISIYAGMLFGLLAVLAFDLNLFEAILDKAGKNGQWQLIATGIVIGLGSGPTHEVIRAVQEYKKSKKSGNAQA